MAGEDFGAGVEVGSGAGYFENAVVGAGAHVVFEHGFAQDSGAVGGKGAVGGDVARAHLGVAVHGGLVGEAGGLYLAGPDHAGSYVGAGLACGARRKLIEWHRHDFALYVDAVEERPGYTTEVFLDGSSRAGTGFCRMVVVTAGAWVHRGHEHERCRIIYLIAGARHADMAVFEGLSQYLEDSAGKFWKFIEEEYAVVGKGYLAGHRVGASADHGYGRYGVMR